MTESRSSRTKYTVLGMLSLENMTGYEISKAIRRSTNHFWSESEGQIYPALALCVKEGLTTYKEKPSKTSRQPKKVYSISTKGKKVLREWLKKDPQSALVRNELLLKLFFGHQIDSKDNVHHIIRQKKQIEQELVEYLQIRETLVAQHKNSPELKYWLITLDYGITLSKAELSWCNNVLKTLKI